MKLLLVACSIALLYAGCASQVSRRSPHPVIREFTVAGVDPGIIEGREKAEVVAWAYFHEFDDSGSIQLSAELSDRWVFSARAGDFMAVPVADIVVMKDGSMISQRGVAPRVRLTRGRWLYDFREVRQILWNLDDEVSP